MLYNEAHLSKWHILVAQAQSRLQSTELLKPVHLEVDFSQLFRLYKQQQNLEDIIFLLQIYKQSSNLMQILVVEVWIEKKTNLTSPLDIAMLV